MNTIKLNIGLENNPYSHREISSYLQLTCGIEILSREEVGEYNGESERTLVSLNHSHDDVEITLETVKLMTELFTQDCIAVKINDVGYLVYNPEYKGEKFEFNNEYFIEP